MKSSSEMTHLVVETGPESGRRITVPGGGARLGRAEGNDLVLNDPSVSRFQCRFYFKDGIRLAVADLASTNETLVNDRPIQDVKLTVGDRIEVGGSVLAVTRDTFSAAPPSSDRSPSDIDLGLRSEAPDSRRPGDAKRRLNSTVWAAAAVGVLLVGVAWGLHRRVRGPSRPASAPGTAPEERALWIHYEKVEASTENIFRYHLRLRDNRVSVQIDNLEDDRHVHREERVPQNLVDELARSIERSGFFDMSSEYTGIAPDVWDQLDLEIGLDRRVHRVRVINRVEPDRFREVRSMLEGFARNHIGLYAMALPPDQLVELARESWLQGQKLFDARAVRVSHLAQAIRAFHEVETLLETIEPKPDFYADAVAAREECRRLLQERFDSYMFRAERAIRLRDWATADDHLRRILDLIQDRSDERYERAYRKLLDVQRRLERQRR